MLGPVHSLPEGHSMPSLSARIRTSFARALVFSSYRGSRSSTTRISSPPPEVVATRAALGGLPGESPASRSALARSQPGVAADPKRRSFGRRGRTVPGRRRPSPIPLATASRRETLHEEKLSIAVCRTRFRSGVVSKDRTVIAHRAGAHPAAHTRAEALEPRAEPCGDRFSCRQGGRAAPTADEPGPSLGRRPASSHGRKDAIAWARWVKIVCSMRPGAAP